MMLGTTNIKFIDAQQAKLAYQYKNTKRKLYKTNAAIWKGLPVAIYSICTPDDGWDCRPKHVELDLFHYYTGKKLNILI